MEQKTVDRFLSAFIGIGIGAVILTAAVLTGVVAASAAVAGVVVVATVPAVFLAATAAYRLEKVDFRPVSAVIGGLVVVLSGMGMGYHIKKHSPHQHAAADKSPIENARSVSFIDHKNTFNAATQNNKKTLVLAAKDFSAAPKSPTA